MTVMPPLEDKKLLDDLLNKKVKIEGTPFEKRSTITNFDFLVPDAIPCWGMDFLHAPNARWWWQKP